MACTWFGEICSCCCLTVLLCPAWVLLSKIYKPFAGSLYYICQRNLMTCIGIISFKISNLSMSHDSRRDSGTRLPWDFLPKILIFWPDISHHKRRASLKRCMRELKVGA